jgi:SAM-dependent methyltransferase
MSALARLASLARNGLRAARRRGPLSALALGARWATFPAWSRSQRWRSRTFELDGDRYPYLLHNYNLTWCNERAVEVPLAWRHVERHAGKAILEVGNVLSHYHPTRHDVVDKFERAPGVVNQDVVDFEPGRRYDLIVCISTLEHVGWDELPRDPGKPLRAVAHLERLLAPGGTLWISIPLGYNSDIDALLDRDAFPWTERRHLRRISDDNRWAETDWATVRECRYDDRWPGASGLLVGIIRR